MNAKTIHVKVTVDTDELREWAGKHADCGHHGVAHVLYKAARDVESLSEQATREAVAAAIAKERAEWVAKVEALTDEGMTDAGDCCRDYCVATVHDLRLDQAERLEEVLRELLDSEVTA